MKVQIAVAAVAHAPLIASVAAEALAISVDIESPQVRRILDGGGAFVAIEDEQVRGFVSNFITLDASGKRRFELDLLAVSPSRQGCGIGRRLVESSLRAARESGATTVRALVRRDNRPMQRLCSRVGFQRSANTFQLYVNQGNSTERQISQPHSARVIAVDTLTYSGYWLEGDLCQGTIDEARQLLRNDSSRTLIGAVVADYDRTTIDLLRTNAFERIGDFDWWTFTL